MNTSRGISSLLAAAALAATLVACGGGSAHPSKAAFIKQADALCLRGSAAQSALSQPSSNAQLPGYVKHIYAIERGVVSNLRALTPPTGDQATVSSMLGNVDKALAFESNVEAAAATGNQSQINDAQAMGAEYLNRANTAAARYGFKECGNT
jgi:hypothetical protein